MSTTDQAEYWLDERHLAYHRRQFSEPYRSTQLLGEWLKETLRPAPRGAALDVACGAGANMYYLASQFPEVEWTGIDLADELFPIGTRLMQEAGARRLPRFVKGDIYRLAEYFPAKSFDVVYSLQTLSWMPAYEPLLGTLFSMAKPGGVIVVSSLFTDALVDAKIELKLYRDSRCAEAQEGIFYNVYCLERFVAECKNLGACRVEVRDFEIDRDLSRPTHRQMGTYTERLADGRRLQISGPLLMPWKFLLIHV